MKKRLLALLLAFAITIVSIPFGTMQVSAAEIPSGAPFTAITTDAGAVSAIKEMSTVTYSGYSTYENVPYYHVTIPEGATEVYVTHPSSEDPFADTSYGSAYGYYAETTGWTGGGMSYAFEEAEDGYKITLPLSETAQDWSTGETYELSFVADEDGYVSHAVAVERNDYSPIAFFTFEYAQAAHSHTYEAVVTAPTCTAGGYTTYTCSCGESYTGDVTEATGHSYADGVCTVCGAADPDYAEPAVNYTVDFIGKTTSANIDVAKGVMNTLTIAVNQDVTFETLELKFKYDTSVLNFKSMGLAYDYTVVTEDGTITATIAGPGTLTAENGLRAVFMAQTAALGDATVTLKSIKVDGTEILAEPISVVTTCGYKAELPTGEGYTVAGEAYAAVGGDYTFTVDIAEGYQATESFAVSANGTVLTADENGVYTVSAVSENLVITVEGVEVVETEDTEPTKPFTAITTDDGTVIAAEKITFVKNVKYNGFQITFPYYHVKVPAGTTYIDVTYPESANATDYAFYADTTNWSGDYFYAGGTGRLPLNEDEMSFVSENGTAPYAVATETSEYRPIAFFTFEYEEGTTPEVPSDEPERKFTQITAGE
ncbi:MAG: hypothetical protein J6K30_00740, partial [Oscillospiraceae bacterium]|nr:hypothetical protein [Oscillospiraceae bacterium]